MHHASHQAIRSPRRQRRAQAVSVVALAAALVLIGFQWGVSGAVAICLTVFGVAGILGFGPGLIGAYILDDIRRQVRAEIAAETQPIATEMHALAANVTQMLTTELDGVRSEIEAAIHATRDEGRMDGILRERLGRVAGDPPRPRSPRPQYRRDRLTDTGGHLRPVED